MRRDQTDRLDIVALGDLRFGGGTSTALASEIRALAAAGYRIGLLPVEGQVLRFPHPFHPAVAALIDEGQARLVAHDERIEARLCILHHPQVFAALPLRPWGIRAEQAVLVAHHPPLDATGVPQYDWRAIESVVADLFGPHLWAPVGPKVREQFDRIGDSPSITPDDWTSVIDADVWSLPRDGFLGPRPVIGRHSRPDPLKWPDDRESFLDAYPDDPRMAVRLLGYGPALDAVVGRRPENWRVHAFESLPVRRFLGGIDVFVYFHGSRWVEAFGRAILEAAASGAVPVLPPDFEPLFGEAAIYCEGSEVRDTVLGLHADARAFQRQSRRAVAVVRERFGAAQAVARIVARIGPPAARRDAAFPTTVNRFAPAGTESAIPSSPPGVASPPTAPAPALAGGRPARILFLTSNGIGMGHLVRSLAVARRLPASVQPVVVSMSRAFGVAQSDGIHVEFLPYFRSVRLEEEFWNECLKAEIAAILDFYDPQVFVFDGNVPYPGMVQAIERLPQLWKVWLRRAMWAPGTGQRSLAASIAFDAILEPGEVAGMLDRGPTTSERSRTIVMPPVLYLREGEALDRSAARAALDLPETGLAGLLQLGAGNNFDLSQPRDRAIARLAEAPGIRLVSADWLISDRAPSLPPAVGRLRDFPFARYLGGFDFAIAAAGYNTFHENLRAGLPTLFTPNQNPFQDEQWRRARYAEARGLALCGLPGAVHRFDNALSRLLDPGERARLRTACLRIGPTDGAERMARYLTDMAAIRRCWR